MCGIVAAVAQRDVAPLLIAGLKALEYRGYDSSGVAVLDHGAIRRVRAKGKVREMEALYLADPLPGGTGIAHTRWATHGVPSEANAHPHIAGRVAIVHNGIIENYASLRAGLQADGHVFTSETDTEVMAVLIDRHLGQGMRLREAVLATVRELEGAYAIAVVSSDEPGRVVGARRGAPLLVGLGIGENFLGSDAQALIQVTNKMLHLDENDVVEITRDSVQVFALDGTPVVRPVHESELSTDAVERGEYRHYMQKEIFEQPRAIADTLEARLGAHGVLPNIFGIDSDALLRKVRGLHIIACGTSYHAGLVAKYWIEEYARLPVSVEVASEYRYRETVVPEGTLFVAISQSGETADTLAAMRESRRRGYLGTLAICNVPESSVVREADLKLMTRAGPEIGVASTKAFTTQLAGLALLTLELARRNGLADDRYAALCAELQHLPRAVENALQLEPAIIVLAADFIHRQHALFLGRGVQYPVAMEGALKLKEISYIHAEAYAAGELKHGPLALVDENMPVIAVAPNGPLLDKLKSNLQEVRARGGRLIVFADGAAGMDDMAGHGAMLRVESGGSFIAPAVFTVPLQLLAYHVAVLRGTDVDQPRNLAKSVTVE
ncbi:glutamine--fructose-6-phosphate aminotransferase [Rhodanobacter sp. FW510-R12]|uniref:glutamine--fructose-6-phosphate transaminase (isomerizing) n=1 Tax=unclassified Rhodanobacter TaxID=2621553 RepID=UPI0007AA3D2F|nr:MULTISPECIES: glutamine--fructose-6-phosphate transaminase (isomerizing) [unclassified Rhodanobacter]KZC16092.1 glutamine--fructose-6-phosphate aminotransferase [Rhodanobacter sp. FW104-R8]KZC26674.1 glutamine--fructose-6-phosphate aminotransferase [Rhodanobacter sp. FW510-T8]KZC30321.1 glutamine--fructose-6-phosphate aminotransferase [Rhodanobacter sp. FW510-R10]